MKCPSCGFIESRVIDSRTSPEGDSIRRRRECLSCKRRFTTFEMLEVMPLFVIKKDGSREVFDRNKVLVGIAKATEKRPVNPEDIVIAIEQELQNEMRQEITSREIGERVIRMLKERDAVAYVRFVSVYREFNDAETFINELRTLEKE